MGSPGEQRWPGEHLGLPQAGPRSIGRLGRRIAAIFIDWAIAYLLALAFFSRGPWDADRLAIYALFVGIQLLFLVIINGSPGHLILRMRVVPLKPGRLGFWRPLVRTALLSLVIPALIVDADQRGLHDRAAGTLLVRV